MNTTTKELFSQRLDAVINKISNLLLEYKENNRITEEGYAEAMKDLHKIRQMQVDEIEKISD